MPQDSKGFAKTWNDGKGKGNWKGGSKGSKSGKDDGKGGGKGSKSRKGDGKGGSKGSKSGNDHKGIWVRSDQQLGLQLQVINVVNSETQPLTGIAYEALQEIVGFWTTKTEKYKITESWKIMKATRRGQVTWVHDLTWSDDRCTILWGDEFFFDPVDLYTSADSLNWYAQSDANKENASYVLSRSEKELEGFDGVQMGPQASRQDTECATEDVAIPPPDMSFPRTRHRGKYLSDRETITMSLQWWEGALKFGIGDALRVVSIGGMYGEIITLESTQPHTKPEPKPTLPKTSTLHMDPANFSSSSDPPLRQQTKPGKVAPGPKNHKPTSGDGADALELISGIWVGDREESYNLTTNWRCVKTSTGGRQQVFDNLSWDADRGLILWGASYWFDAADLESVEKNFQLTWYHQSDKAKSKPMFTWSKA